MKPKILSYNQILNTDIAETVTLRLIVSKIQEHKVDGCKYEISFTFLMRTCTLNQNVFMSDITTIRTGIKNIQYHIHLR